MLRRAEPSSRASDRRWWQLVPLLLPLALPYAAPAAPPPLTPTRYDEDYSYLRNPDERTGAWWERLKFLPLDEEGHAWVTLGDEGRLRYESYWNRNFGPAPLRQDGYGRFREMPYGALHVGDGLQLFVQLIAAYGLRSQLTASPSDITNLDVLQALAEGRIPLGDDVGTLVLRGGRQVMVYGSGRLINPGPNIRLSFDGGLVRWERRGWRVDAFYVRPVVPTEGLFDDRSGPSFQLWSVYATRTIRELPHCGFDLYYVGFRRDDTSYEQGEGRELRNTFGPRLFCSRDFWHFDIEGNVQAGRFADGGLLAWSAGGQGRFTATGHPLLPWVGWRLGFFSGDGDAADGTLGTYNSIFPEGGYYGETGVVGPANLVDAHVALGAALGAGFSVEVDGLLFWRLRLGDGVYGMSGNLLRASGGSAERFIGAQAETKLDWEQSRNLHFHLAVAALAPGIFIEATGPSSTVYFLATHVVWAF